MEGAPKFKPTKESPHNDGLDQLDDFEIAELDDAQRDELREALDKVGAQVSQKKS